MVGCTLLLIELSWEMKRGFLWDLPQFLNKAISLKSQRNLLMNIILCSTSPLMVPNIFHFICLGLDAALLKLLRAFVVSHLILKTCLRYKHFIVAIV